eukprot:PhM_4_TR13193/c0_g1_i1/m.105190/K12832/SF3B5, SF3B10; splicing factor 3B subunit 5
MPDPFVHPGHNPTNAEHLIARHTGTGHADTTVEEFAASNARDTIAAVVSSHPLLSYMAIAENESVGRVRYRMLQKMADPLQGSSNINTNNTSTKTNDHNSAAAAAVTTD